MTQLRTDTRRTAQTVRRKLALAAVAAAPVVYFVVETAPRIGRS